MSYTPKRRFTTAQKDWHCRKFDEAQRAYILTPNEYCRETGLVLQVLCRWLRERGIAILNPHADAGELSPPREGDGRVRYWRHGGICTPRADVR